MIAPRLQATCKAVGSISLVILLAACGQSDVLSNGSDRNSAANDAPITLSPLELQARKTIVEESSARAKQKKLEAAAATVMEQYLFDPSSARFSGLREGRGGAICGKYNAKNRYGAYVGFKDFVISGDRKSFTASDRNDGISTELFTSFASAFLESCATDQQRKAHEQMTSMDADTTMNVDENLTVETPDDPFAEE